LPHPRGSEPAGRRPVLIVQADAFNRSRLRTLIVVTLTSNARLAMASGNVALSRRVTGLPRGSVANVSQVLTLDRGFLARRVRPLPVGMLARIDSGLRLVLDL